MGDTSLGLDGRWLVQVVRWALGLFWYRCLG